MTLGGKSGVIDQRVSLQSDGSMISDALLTFVCIDLKSKKALPLEGELKAHLETLNAGAGA
ncbi:MAG TPA: thioesterase, partial [Erwinia persicina]|nr:thioesterase [Erwinia persicina]